MRAPRNSFVSKARQSTFVPKWGFPPRPSHPLLDGETPGPSQKTETVTTKSAISVSPLPDSQVKIEWAEETRRGSVVADSCSISSQGDVLTITYKCPPSDTLSTKNANDFFSCLNSKIADDSSSAKSSSEKVITSAQPKDSQKCALVSEVNLKDSQNAETHNAVNNCLNLGKKINNSSSQKISSEEVSKSSQVKCSQGSSNRSTAKARDNQRLVTHKVVNRGATSMTLSYVELNQTERVSIEKSASVEDTRQKVTSSEHSSCEDVDGKQKGSIEKSSSDGPSLAKELNQKINSDENVQEKCLPENVDSTTNGAVDGTRKKTAMKRSLSSPMEGIPKKLFKMAGRYSESYMGQVGSSPSTSRGRGKRNANFHTIRKCTKGYTSSATKEPQKKISNDNHRLPKSFMAQARTHQNISTEEESSEGELFATCSGNSSPYHSTCEEVDMEESGTTDITDLYRESDSERRESIISSSTPPTLDDITSTGMSGLQNTNDKETRDGPKIFPNRMMMRSYQNGFGKDVWELSLNFD